jgi:hypothetical protein
MKVLALFLVVAAAGWQTIDFNGLFSFRLPDGFVRSSSNAPDDVRAEYQKDKTKLIVLWGQTESVAYQDRKQNSMNDYQEATSRISGRPGNIRTYALTRDSKRRYVAELNLGNWDKGVVQLYMRLESDDPAMLSTADQIFKSVSLPLPSPERRPSNP